MERVLRCGVGVFIAVDLVVLRIYKAAEDVPSTLPPWFHIVGAVIFVGIMAMYWPWKRT